MPGFAFRRQASLLFRLHSERVNCWTGKIVTDSSPVIDSCCLHLLLNLLLYCNAYGELLRSTVVRREADSKLVGTRAVSVLVAVFP